jgi:hypothetical protein
MRERDRERGCGTWKSEMLAAVAGVLLKELPCLSTFEVVRLVWNTADHESPAIGGLRLLARCRRSIHQQAGVAGARI